MLPLSFFVYNICYCSLVPRSSNGFCRCFAFQIGKICYHHCIIRHFQFKKCLPVNSNLFLSYTIITCGAIPPLIFLVSHVMQLSFHLFGVHMSVQMINLMAERPREQCLSFYFDLVHIRV